MSTDQNKNSEDKGFFEKLADGISSLWDSTKEKTEDVVEAVKEEAVEVKDAVVKKVSGKAKTSKIQGKDAKHEVTPAAKPAGKAKTTTLPAPRASAHTPKTATGETAKVSAKPAAKTKTGTARAAKPSAAKETKPAKAASKTSTSAKKKA